MSKKLPEGWKKVKLGKLFDIKKGKKVIQLDEKTEDSIRCIQIEDLRNNDFIKYCDNDPKYLRAVESDILIAWDGANAGTVGYGISGAVGSTLAILRCKEDKILTPYVARFLQGKFNYLRNTCTGATIPHISRQALEGLSIPIPPLEEQERVVSILEKVEKAIQKREESNRLLDEYLKSVFIDMFGDPVTNTKGWKKIKLKDISNYLKRGKSPKYSERSSINVINQKCIYWRDFKPENCKFYNEEFIDKIKGEFLDSGDIVINSTGTGTLGRALVLKNIKSNLYVADSHITVMKVNEFANPVYITTLLELKNIQSQVYAKCVNGSTNQIELSVSKLGSYKIMVPPIESQNKFADIVNQVDKLKVQMESSLKELENNFNSLMQKAFNGEL